MREEEGDIELANDLLNAMHKAGADFTLTFRTLPAHLEDDATGAQDTRRHEGMARRMARAAGAGNAARRRPGAT